MERLFAVVLAGAMAVPAASPLHEASRLSGLRIRHPVPTSAVSAARYRALLSETESDSLEPALQRLGVTSPQSPAARYDVRTHRLFVQRSPRPNRRALIHEYVRALIDQNFDLRRLLPLRVRDHDRWEAAQEMVDGVASLSSGLPAPGRGLAGQLRYLGGRTALANALRSFPRTTEQLLHVDKFLERERALPISLPPQAGGVALTASETFGELDVRDLLQAAHVQGAAAAAAGWGGGRLAEYGDVAAVVLRWDTPADASEWQAAVPRYVDAVFAGTPRRTCPPLDACWGDVAAGVYGTTSVLAVGPGSAGVAAALLAGS